MKAHSVWLSVVVWSFREMLAHYCSLNETTEAVPGIVRQLVLVAPHISSIFISCFYISISIFVSLVSEFYYLFFSTKLKSIRTHIDGDKRHTLP